MDLTTTDVPAAIAFYGALFGWGDSGNLGSEAGPYQMFLLRDKPVAGVMPQTEEQRGAGIPPAWSVYIDVPDVDVTAKSAEVGGGTTVVPPMDVLTAGRMLMFRDPQGATIGCWQAREHKGSGYYGEPGAPSWIELSTTDPDAAVRFYEGVFGWTTAEQAGYRMFQVGDRPIGGLQPLPGELAGHPAFWAADFQVASCDQATELAASLGAQTLTPPTDVPGGGVRFSVLRDPQGAVFGLFE